MPANPILGNVFAQLGDHHSGELHQGSAEAKAERMLHSYMRGGGGASTDQGQLGI
jgi:hypothetical protein